MYMCGAYKTIKRVNYTIGVNHVRTLSHKTESVVLFMYHGYVTILINCEKKYKMYYSDIKTAWSSML